MPGLAGFRGADASSGGVEEVMEFADLGPLAERPMNGLSKGMAQRLCFGRALLQDPPVLILDEPAAGLDPKARMEFKNLVHILARNGHHDLHLLTHPLGARRDVRHAALHRCRAHRASRDGRMLQQRNGSGACVVDIQVHGAETAARGVALHASRMETGRRRAKGGVRAEYQTPDREQLAEQLRRMISDGILGDGLPSAGAPPRGDLCGCARAEQRHRPPCPQPFPQFARA